MPGCAGSVKTTTAGSGTTTRYLAPELTGRLCLEVDGNGYSGELSADAAGIVATLFTLGQLAADNQGTDVADVLIDRYHFLRDFARDHPEAAEIFRAID